LEESNAAYEEAKRLQETAAARLRAADEQTRKHFARRARARRRGPMAAPVSAVALFRSPQSARQAFIASFVLGPPKALDPKPTSLIH
jgi:hypothetical protein